MSRLIGKPWLGVTIILTIALIVTIGLVSARSVMASPGKAEGHEAVVMPFAEYAEITPTIGAPNTFHPADIMTVDQQAHRLYLADSMDQGIDVFDVSTRPATYMETIPIGTGVNGVEVAKNVNELFVGMSPNPPTIPTSSVAIIDLTSETVITTLDTGGANRTDEIGYDPMQKEIYAANSDDGFVTVIDATTNAIIKKITLPTPAPGLEQPRYNPNDGMMYLTGSAGGGALYQFDPVANTLKHTYFDASLDSPTGLAINPETDQALLGGADHITLWNFKTQKVVKVLGQWGGADVTAYNPVADVYFAALQAPQGWVMGILSGENTKFLSVVPTIAGAHQVAYSEANNMIYTFDAPNGTGPGTATGPGYLMGFPIPQALHGKSFEVQNKN